MKRNKLIDRIEELADKSESPEATAVLFMLALAMRLDKEKLMFNAIKELGYTVLIPEGNMLSEASEEVREMLKQLNFN